MVVKDWAPVASALVIEQGAAEQVVEEVVELARTDSTPVTDATTLEFDSCWAL